MDFPLSRVLNCKVHSVGFECVSDIYCHLVSCMDLSAWVFTDDIHHSQMEQWMCTTNCAVRDLQHHLRIQFSLTSSSWLFWPGKILVQLSANLQTSWASQWYNGISKYFAHGGYRLCCLKNTKKYDCYHAEVVWHVTKKGTGWHEFIILNLKQMTKHGLENCKWKHTEKSTHAWIQCPLRP